MYYIESDAEDLHIKVNLRGFPERYHGLSGCSMRIQLSLSAVYRSFKWIFFGVSSGFGRLYVVSGGFSRVWGKPTGAF